MISKPPISTVDDGPEDNEGGGNGADQMFGLDGWERRGRRLFYVGKPTHGKLHLQLQRTGEIAMLWTGRARDIEQALQPLNLFIHSVRTLHALGGRRSQYKLIGRNQDGTSEFFICTLPRDTEYSVGEDGALIWWDGITRIPLLECQPVRPLLEYEVQQHLINLTRYEAPPELIKAMPALPRRKLKPKSKPSGLLPRRK